MKEESFEEIVIIMLWEKQKNLMVKIRDCFKCFPVEKEKNNLENMQKVSSSIYTTQMLHCVVLACGCSMKDYSLPPRSSPFIDEFGIKDTVFKFCVLYSGSGLIGSKRTTKEKR